LSKYKKYINHVLKEELSPFYIGIPNLYKIFFREVEGFKAVSAAVFKKYKKGTIYYILRRAVNITNLKA